jgi:hypothetical protein
MGHRSVMARLFQPSVISVCSCKIFSAQEVTEETEGLRAMLSILEMRYRGVIAGPSQLGARVCNSQ